MLPGPQDSALGSRRQRWRWFVLFVASAASAALVPWLLQRHELRHESELVAMSDELRSIYREQARPSVARPADPSKVATVPPLMRAPLDEPMARLFYPTCEEPLYTYDPDLCSRRRGNVDCSQVLPEYHGPLRIRTNSLGMREDSEVAELKPDLRILVTGASNVDGVCENAESATNLLEKWLRKRKSTLSVEALNVGSASYCFYSFLNVLEHYLPLEPDVFVVVAYGGNDFFNNVKFHRFFNYRDAGNDGPHTYKALLDVDDLFLQRLLGTEIVQAIYFLNNPEDVGFAIEAACSATAEMDALCRKHGIRLVCAYLPPPMRGQPHLMREYERRACELLHEPPEIFDVSDRMADVWLTFAAARGIAHVDLRTRFRSTQQRLYWTTDTHVSVAGQQAIAKELLAQF